MNEVEVEVDVKSKSFKPIDRGTSEFNDAEGRRGLFDRDFDDDSGFGFLPCPFESRCRASERASE